MAYTATFGGGWSATISMEDPQERRYPILTNLGGAALVQGATLFAAAEAAIQIFDPLTGLPINSAFVGQRQRNSMPDIVANVPGRSDLGLVPAVWRRPPDPVHRRNDPGGQQLRRRDL